MLFQVAMLMFAIIACQPAPDPSPAPVASPTPRPTQPALAPDQQASAIKIITDQAGLYQLDAGLLAQAGWAGVEPAQLALTNQDQPVAFWVAGQGAELRLYFYAEAYRSPFTRENVYWLRRDSQQALRIPTVQPETGESAPAAAYETTRFEENTQYAPQVESGDHWLWNKLVAPTSQELNFDLPNLLSGTSLTATLRVEVWGSTGMDAPAEGAAPEHRLQVTLNDTPLGESDWAGRGRHRLTLNIPAGVLKPQANLLVLSLPGGTQALVDILSVDWVEVTTPVDLSNFDRAVHFTSTGGSHAAQAASGELWLLDLADPRQPRRLAESGFTAQPGSLYAAIPASASLPPLYTETVLAPPDFRAASQSADYLLIGAPELLQAAAPLVELRQAQGLQVLSLALQDVYDQFNAGIVAPEAIRALLAYAHQTWASPPRYVLLLGDFSYDVFGYTAPPPPNALPSFFIYTEFGGETVSDVLFTLLDDDPLPDLALGRLPFGDPAQISAVVDKISAYEQAAFAPPSLLAVADGQEDRFAEDARQFMDLLAPAYTTDLFSPPAGVESAGDQIAAQISQGYSLVAYFGHGSLNQWGKDRLFDVEHVSALSNPARLPVVLNLTCLTGLFAHPKVSSLAEAMLGAPLGGAVALIAPTSLTLPTDQSTLSAPLARGLLSATPLTLGELLLQAQRQVPTGSAGALDVLHTYILLGDPALTLGFVAPAQ